MFTFAHHMQVNGYAWRIVVVGDGDNDVSESQRYVASLRKKLKKLLADLSNGRS